MRWLTVILFSLSALCTSAQTVTSDRYDARLQRLLRLDVPTIDVSQAKSLTDTIIYLDARELEEYDVSHLPGAQHIGYDDFDIKKVAHLDKGQKLVVYCSVGYRSEKITRKLIKAGYTNVSNLYGSIFEWANVGLPLVDKKDNPTDTVHTYSRRWSRWVISPTIKKVW